MQQSQQQQQPLPPGRQGWSAATPQKVPEPAAPYGEDDQDAENSETSAGYADEGGDAANLAGSTGDASNYNDDDEVDDDDDDEEEYEDDIDIGADEEDEIEIDEESGFGNVDAAVAAYRASMYNVHIDDDGVDVNPVNEDQDADITGDDDSTVDDFSEDEAHKQDAKGTPSRATSQPQHPEAEESGSSDGGGSGKAESVGSPVGSPRSTMGLSSPLSSSSSSSSTPVVPEHTFVKAVGGKHKMGERGAPIMGSRQKVQPRPEVTEDAPPPLAPAASVSTLNYKGQGDLLPLSHRSGSVGNMKRSAQQDQLPTLAPQASTSQLSRYTNIILSTSFIMPFNPFLYL